MTDFYTDTITIYHDVPSDGVNPRRFDRRVVKKCNIQQGMLQSANGTVEKVVNATTIITKSVENYRTPLEYAHIPVDMRESRYTVNVNDFVVLSEVEDEVTTSREFQELQTKYEGNGVSVTAVNAYIHGTAVDNVQIIHA